MQDDVELEIWRALGRTICIDSMAPAEPPVYVTPKQALDAYMVLKHQRECMQSLGPCNPYHETFLRLEAFATLDDETFAKLDKVRQDLVKQQNSALVLQAVLGTEDPGLSAKLEHAALQTRI